MKPRTKQLMEGRECFLKDLTEGSTFRMRHTGGTVYTFVQRGENYVVTTDNGSFYASPTTPVRPLIKF